jgi:hypothetical protein
MRRSVVWAAAGIAIASFAFIGFRQGERAQRETAATTAAVATVPETNPSAPVHADRKAHALPDDLDTLDGIEFIEAIPDLERRAKDGDQKATLLLIHRLQECAGYVVQNVEDIRARVDKEYQRQLDIQQRMPDRNRTLVIDELWHAARLKQDIDKRDRCLALGPRDLKRRLDWAELALSRHERDVTIDLARWGSVRAEGPERVRELDRIGALADGEKREIERLVAAGDVDAMHAAVIAYGGERGDSFGVIEADPTQAYAIAYALSLTGGGDEKMAVRLLQYIGGRLSAEQIEAAKTRGEAIYAECCNGGSSKGDHHG